MSILTYILQERTLAKKKLSSQRMLFPEEQKGLIILLRSGSNKSRTHIRMKKIRIRTKASALITELIDKFDEDFPGRKDIRTLRKALQTLASERFPKGGKKRALVPYKDDDVEENDENEEELEDELDELEEEPKKKKIKKKKSKEVKVEEEEEEEEEDEEEDSEIEPETDEEIEPEETKSETEEDEDEEDEETEEEDEEDEAPVKVRKRQR